MLKAPRPSVDLSWLELCDLGVPRLSRPRCEVKTTYGVVANRVNDAIEMAFGQTVDDCGIIASSRNTCAAKFFVCVHTIA